jgi:hypothetical protein
MLTMPPAVVESVTLHVADPSGPSIVGLHESDVIRVRVKRSIKMLRDDPALSDAVIVAFPSASIVPADTVKDALDPPEVTSTDVGTDKSALSVDSLTDRLPVLESVTVQFARSPLCNDVVEHVSDVIMTALVNENVADREDPFNDAVTVAIWSMGTTAPTFAVKVALVAPEATETDAGTDSNALLLATATVPPPVLDRVTVHVVAPPTETVVGEQASDVMVIGMLKMSVVALEEPFSIAVIVADWSPVAPLTAMRNVTLVVGGGTGNTAGAVTDGWLLVMVTFPPPALDRVTTHVAVPEDPTPLTGSHVSDEIVTIPLTESEADRLDPLNDAVSVTTWSIALGATAAVNVAVVASGATEMVAGRATDKLLLTSETVAPPVFDIVTVQVLVCDGATVDGLHANELTIDGPTSDRVAARDTPFKEAEILTV